MAKKLALLIGNDKYNDKRFTAIKVSEDITALKAVLERSDIAGFDDVESIINKSKDAIESSISTLFHNKHRDDLLLLYFSGHGLLDNHADFYLALKGTKYDQPLGSALTPDFIKKAMDNSYSRRQILILDCCHSGAFERGTKGNGIGVPAITEDTFANARETDAVSGYGRVVLTSSTATQLSWHGNEVIGDTELSLFTHYLVEGLKSGKAAINGAKEITVDQLYKYTYERVTQAKPEMNPQRWAKKQEGELIIAKNPYPKVLPKILPGGLQYALNHEYHYVRLGAIHSKELKHLLEGDDNSEVLVIKRMLEELKNREPVNEVRQAIDQLFGKENRNEVKLPADKLKSDTVVFQDNLKDESRGPEMVVIPSGEFLMGSLQSEEGHDENESPQHKVTINKPFAMGQYAVTFKEYDKFAVAIGIKKPKGSFFWNRKNRPVINVSWQDAKDYASWLSEQTGKVYRLPSEAEWEYAARAGTTTVFHFGNTINTNQANYDGNFGYGDSGKGEYREKTVSVGSFSANDFGLYEMHGNVWEWVEDCCHDNYNNAPNNGDAWVTDEGIYRVLRGGSWNYEPWNLRAADRIWNTPETRGNYFGFRLARTL